MNTKQLLLIVISLQVFISCDPLDSRLKIHNTTSDTIVVRLLFDNELPNYPKSQRGKRTVILPNESKNIGIFNRWEGEFKRALPDTLLNLIVVEKYDLINNPNIWDSIYYLEKYPQKKVSLKEMKDQKWMIKYP